MKFLILILLSFDFQPTSAAVAKSKVLLVLIDGMRWDNYGLNLSNFDEIKRTGVKADWMDGAYVTYSLPSMTTIATGLYPESHGVVHNVYWNTEYKNRTYSYYDALNITEWFDTGSCEPIWVTAINQGLKAGTINYPGGSVAIKGVKPTRDIPYSRWVLENYHLKSRVDDAISWLTNDEFDLVMLYLDEPDEHLHEYGIGEPGSYRTLMAVDDTIGYLFERINQRELTDVLNVIMVSDHGHVNVDVRKHISIYEYIDEADVEFLIGATTIVLILPKEGKLEKIYGILHEAHPALHVYKKEEFPERFHYANHPRILPLIGFVDPGWSLHLNNNTHSNVPNATHGYDNDFMVMKSIFYAKGPAFRAGYRSPHLESVNVYPLMCELLGIAPSPNNGSRSNYISMLAPSCSSHMVGSIPHLLLMFIIGIMSL